MADPDFWYQDGPHMVYSMVVESITYCAGDDNWATYRIKGANPSDERQRRIIRKFYNAIYTRQPDFQINNSLFEVDSSNDPASGQQKKAVITYRMNRTAPRNRQRVYEYESMNFQLQVYEIKYGPSVVLDYAPAYERFNRALKDAIPRARNRGFFDFNSFGSDAVTVKNDEFGGWDPQPGVEKTVAVKIVPDYQGQAGTTIYGKEYERWPNIESLKKKIAPSAIPTWSGQPNPLF